MWGEKMNWVEDTQKAINYIENNINGIKNVADVANYICYSLGHFQKMFYMVTGLSVSEYIRNRKLSIAGQELINSRNKIIDISEKYGYETPESFARAFSRFHGFVPSKINVPENHLKIFNPLTIQINIKGGFIVSRKLIPNVTVVNYDGNNVAFFITLLEAMLGSIGEKYSRAKLSALSGEGNRFCWTDSGWFFGNETTQSIHETPFEAERRVFAALGWKAKYMTVQHDKDGNFMNTDPIQIRHDFITSIDKGYPVMMRYIKHDDCSLNIFFGYENDGQKIIGYNYNKGYEVGVSKATDFETPVSWDAWENNVSGYILLQSKSEPMSERETALSVFRYVLEHARKDTEINGKKIGFAAWESFLYHLEHDDFSALSAEDIGGRFIIYCDGLCQINARKEVLPYYQSLAEQFSEWRDELNIAISALKDCASYGGFLWKQGFTFDAAGFEKFRTPEARKILADEGRKAMMKDMEAVKQFEKILNKE